VKNILIFAAPIAAHQISSLPVLINSLLMFFAFSLTASAVYVGNDLSDLDNDRIHPRKRHRPIASGTLSIPRAVTSVFVLGAGALALTGLTTNPPLTVFFLGTYIVINLFYSTRLKAVYGLDIVVLSVLYTLRVVMGADGNAIPTTSWFKSFFVFIFLSLACLKRYSELRLVAVAEETRKGYKRGDADVIREIGVASSLGSIFIFTLYLGSPEVKALYNHEKNLWMLAPLMALFFVRLWISAGRDLVTDDPVVYVLKDRTFHFIILASAVVLSLSI
jgi:4-hydroxybenzoate polyprenyltransferase